MRCGCHWKVEIQIDNAVRLEIRIEQFRPRKIAHLERQYKVANLEYEKMKYLQTQDFSAQIEKIKKAEAAALDEFATMNFTRQKNAN